MNTQDSAGQPEDVFWEFQDRTEEPLPKQGPAALGQYHNREGLFLVGLGFELRAFSLQNRQSIIWAIPQSILVILEMGSHELFAWTGLEQ
jgi:hypothetical protein